MSDGRSLSGCEATKLSRRLRRGVLIWQPSLPFMPSDDQQRAEAELARDGMDDIAMYNPWEEKTCNTSAASLLQDDAETTGNTSARDVFVLTLFMRKVDCDVVVCYEPSPLMWVVLGPDLSQNVVQRSSKANWFGAEISVDSLQDFVTLPAEVNVSC